ncbi:MAG: hypothetical protein ACE5KM_22980 [Planctomycetaceae bacterium]
MTIDYQRTSELQIQMHAAMRCDESDRLNESFGTLFRSLEGHVPWDWRYNATHWALDVGDVCNEIRYSIAWMRASAEYASECNDNDRRSAEFLVSYYADNAATRISSCRDKLALLAWSYYCPFNPDKKGEVLNFEQVRERLTTPVRFGLRFEGHEAFLVELNKLVGPSFQQAKTYRDRKVHRMEPRVMLRSPEAPDQSSYMIPLEGDGDIRRFDEKLAEKYPDEDDRAHIRAGCYVDGVLFDRRAPEDLLWHFEDFDQFTNACWKCLCDATAGSCEILHSREPMLSKASR